MSHVTHVQYYYIAHVTHVKNNTILLCTTNHNVTCQKLECYYYRLILLHVTRHGHACTILIHDTRHTRHKRHVIWHHDGMIHVPVVTGLYCSSDMCNFRLDVTIQVYCDMFFLSWAANIQRHQWTKRVVNTQFLTSCHLCDEFVSLYVTVINLNLSFRAPRIDPRISRVCVCACHTRTRVNRVFYTRTCDSRRHSQVWVIGMYCTHTPVNSIFRHKYDAYRSLVREVIMRVWV